jgi:hypothetical protein
MTKDLKEKAIQFKGKSYVQVKDRIAYFNETYPHGCIETQLVEIKDSMVIFKAVTIPDTKEPNRYFTGYSQASFNDTNSFVNKTSALENAETSAVGRALAFMGIGVIDSVASIDEINKTTYAKPIITNTAKQEEKCMFCGATGLYHKPNCPNGIKEAK